jgi:hypothetical protein
LPTIFAEQSWHGSEVGRQETGGYLSLQGRRFAPTPTPAGGD